METLRNLCLLLCHKEQLFHARQVLKDELDQREFKVIPFRLRLGPEFQKGNFFRTTDCLVVCFEVTPVEGVDHVENNGRIAHFADREQRTRVTVEEVSVDDERDLRLGFIRIAIWRVKLSVQSAAVATH